MNEDQLTVDEFLQIISHASDALIKSKNHYKYYLRIPTLSKTSVVDYALNLPMEYSMTLAFPWYLHYIPDHILRANAYGCSNVIIDRTHHHILRLEVTPN